MQQAVDAEFIDIVFEYRAFLNDGNLQLVCKEQNLAQLHWRIVPRAVFWSAFTWMIEQCETVVQNVSSTRGASAVAAAASQHLYVTLYDLLH